MTFIEKEKLEESLIKLARGLFKASMVYDTNTKEGEMLLNIINSGVGDGYVQEKYTQLFAFSFDEEATMFQFFVKDFLDEHFEIFTKPENNLYKELAVGLDMAVEGLEEVIEICKTDKELKRALKEHAYQESYQPFKTYGFSKFLKDLKGFRWAYFAELSKQIGHHHMQQSLSA